MMNGHYTVAPVMPYMKTSTMMVSSISMILSIWATHSRDLPEDGFNITYKHSNWLPTYGRYGQKVINMTRLNNESMYGINNQSTAVLRRWRNEGDMTEIPSALLWGKVTTL